MQVMICRDCEESTSGACGRHSIVIYDVPVEQFIRPAEVEELKALIRERNSSLKNAFLLLDALQAHNDKLRELLTGFVRDHRQGNLPCRCELCEEAVRLVSGQ